MTALVNARRAAALEAIRPIKQGYVVGLGSGNTMALAVAEISARIRQERIESYFIPTSYQIEHIAALHGLRIVSLNEHPEPDLALDGADEVDENLNLIKGGGGALAKEKVVAAATKKFTIIVDEQKRAKKLRKPVPLEVLPFAYKAVIRGITAIGGKAILREGTGKVGPTITDNGNFILDSDFGTIDDPKSLESRLRSIPGIVETGLFVEMTDEVYVGKLDGTVELLKR